MNPTTPQEPSGSWDSIHVFETAERGRQAHYKLTSTIMLQLITRRGSEGDGSDGDRKAESKGGERKGTEGWKRQGEVSLSGSMTRQVSRRYSCIRTTNSDLKSSEDRAGLAYSRRFFPYYKHWKDDRRDGDQDEKPSAGGMQRLHLL